MKRPMIGILAGMGPRSTAPFVDLVVAECTRLAGARDDIDFPRMMICSQPAPFYENRPPDHPALEAAIREGLRDLERAGADFLAIACNTAHIYHARLAQSVSVPLLDMAALCVDSIPLPREGTPGPVALIASTPTIESGLYQDRLRARGFPLVDPGWQRAVEHLIGATRISSEPALFERLWAGLLAEAREAGAETALVACVDLSGVLRHAVLKGRPRVVDSARSLATAIVKEWLARRDGEDAGAERVRGDYSITTDPASLDLETVHAYLTRSYWSPGVPADVVARAARRSLCFGLHHKTAAGKQQVGYARVVSDGETFAYLCDVYVLEEHRGKGLGKWLVETVLAHPAHANLRRFLLVTRDAHALYERFGFRPLARPEGFMEIHKPRSAS
jgi:aspartate racemase